MSVRVMSWVWDHSTSAGADRLVLLAIADSANDQGRDAYPSVTTIARKAKMDKRTVQRSLRSLVAAGELAVAEFAGQNGTHRYRVIMADGRQDTTPGDTPPPVVIHHPDETPRVASNPSRGGISSREGWQDAPRTILEPSLPIQEPSSSTAVAESRQDVIRVCRHLADRIENNGSRRPRITKRWLDAARLMIDIDKRTEAKIHVAIDWCQSDDFWCSNILSMPKLREKYDALRLAAQRTEQPRRAVSTTDQRVADGMALAQQLRENEAS